MTQACRRFSSRSAHQHLFCCLLHCQLLEKAFHQIHRRLHTPTFSDEAHGHAFRRPYFRQQG